uniref:Carbonic anhydrase CAH0010 n=1 Tax=Chlorella sp. ArM0029B TaxID=1415603 RepID=A0A345AXB6_9CHLO|nr:carbonic anhydrase CAH0010 [Chlorella sp. ArM0029B]
MAACAGKLRGSGRMWVAPSAETHPSAVSISAEGHGLAVEPLARRYLPDGMRVPPGMLAGHASLTASMKGSHMEPTVEVAVSLPEAEATCSATLRRDSMRLSAQSPKQGEGACTLYMSPPSIEATKAALTQSQALALAKPNLSGVEADVTLKGLDVVPFLSNEAAVRQLAVQQAGQPARLRIAGRVRVAGSVRKQQEQAAGGQAADAGGSNSAGAGSWEFTGDLGLESIRVNQLKLWQKLAGRLTVSDTAVSVHGKGLRNETLDLDLALPLLAPAAAAAAAPRQVQAAAPQQLQVAPPPAAEAPVVQAATAATEAEPEAAAAAMAAAAAEDGGAAGEAEASGAEEASGASAPAPEAAAAAVDRQPAEVQRAGGGRLQLRCGNLQVAADMNARGSQLDFKVAALKLDELELASLRGDLQELSCSLNFESATGRGKVSLANPRYSGLRGDSLSGGFRWERDVVRLERLVLQQQRSRYEVQGEYTLPPNTPLPSSAADLALQPAGPGGGAPGGASSAVPAGGRWRVAVSVPVAELQEIVPAARLLQSAASLSPAEYDRAKRAFLQAISRASIKAADLNTQLRSMAEQLAPAAPTAGGAGSPRGDAPRVPAPGAASPSPSAALHLPGIQDMRGQWSGSVQAYGGGSSATSCDFDVKGQAWQWGSYALDALVAVGSYHSEEGVQLQEFVLKAGDAKLLVRGSLLGEHQDAQVLLTDFPIAKLRPIFSKGLRGEGSDADSPINGQLYVTGNITGSCSQPTGEVVVRLYDAAIGEPAPTLLLVTTVGRPAALRPAQILFPLCPPSTRSSAGQTRLSQAQATARLSEQQQLTFNVDVAPAEGHRQSGYVKAAGMVPLAEASSNASGAGSAASSGAAAAAGSSSSTAAAHPHSQQQAQQAVLAAQQQQLDVRLSVKDGGMALLTSVTPDLRWLSGQAAVDVRLRGSLEQPVLSGSASIAKATLECPSVLRWPLTNVAAEVRAGGGLLTVESFEARSGRRGSVRLRGSLPVYASGAGRALLVEPAGQHPFFPPKHCSISPCFSLPPRFPGPQVEAVEAMVEDAGQHNVSLDGLAICLGPDLRAMYPLVMNFGVAGELSVSGPAHPDQVRVRGTLRLPSGDVNLVATQLALDREHANLITFHPDQSPGLDPLVDLVMMGGDLRVAIQGKASEWQDHLTLHYISSKARPDAAGEALEPADAARLFEDKLKAALLAEDGQLALSRLAGTTVSTLMPKIETQGQVGGTRWRLVSAPSIPGLLSLDPSLADPANILSNITMGTEVEIQFGKKLQAAMIRKLQESDVTTQWSLTYKLNNKLRMQFNITSAPPFPKTLMFQFSSEGAGST